jgi:hypothetical protein
MQIIHATALSSCDAASTQNAQIYEVDGHIIRLPPSAPSSFSRQEVVGAVTAALTDVVPVAAFAEAAVQRCADMLGTLSSGALKSCLQKTIRFRSEAVDFGPFLNGPVVATPVVAATAAALLFADRGSFSPELQLFTRGATAALKRMAVILLEDAWVEADDGSTAQYVAALVALALATQRLTEYEPPIAAIRPTLRLAAQAAMSDSVAAWRTGCRRDANVHIQQGSIEALKHAARLLRCVRSFSGDMDMFDTVAELGKCGRLPVSQSLQRVSRMPFCHIIDQHSFRGIAHVLHCPETSFTSRFSLIFDHCTGINPRIANVSEFESRENVKSVRHAQRCILGYALKRSPTVLPTLPGEYVETRLDLDSGVLAAAIGPVCAKVVSGRKSVEVFVLLGLHCPEDEVVMLKPARATRDLFGSLSDLERAKAITHVRSLTLEVKSVLLPDARVAKFCEGTWQLDGRKWSAVVAEGRKLRMPLVQPPAWASDLTSKSQSAVVALQDAAALEDALNVKGDGVVPNAQSCIAALMAAASHAVALRAVSLLRQQYACVSMPTPSLGGGLGSDQLAAYDGDWDVYHLLVLVSRLAPGALRPAAPPNFTIPDAALLRVVERWMAQGMRSTLTSSGNDRDNLAQWSLHPSWRKEMAKAERQLKEHQRAAISRMHQRDSSADCGGHFLIMDTGVGKTITALTYAYRWLCQYGGRTVLRILWITPKGTVENLAAQLQGTWAVPVHVVPRISTATKKQGWRCFGPYVRELCSQRHTCRPFAHSHR